MRGSGDEASGVWRQASRRVVESSSRRAPLGDSATRRLDDPRLPPHSANIRVQIDRLVLDGVNVRAADRPHLQAAIEAELARLIATGGLSPELANGGALPSVRAPQIALNNNPKHLGTSIARSVYGGVGGGE